MEGNKSLFEKGEEEVVKAGSKRKQMNDEKEKNELKLMKKKVKGKSEFHNNSEEENNKFCQVCYDINPSLTVYTSDKLKYQTHTTEECNNRYQCEVEGCHFRTSSTLLLSNHKKYIHLFYNTSFIYYFLYYNTFI